MLSNGEKRTYDNINKGVKREKEEKDMEWAGGKLNDGMKKIACASVYLSIHLFVRPSIGQKEFMKM